MTQVRLAWGRLARAREGLLQSLRFELEICQ
jgi:hypothetical protein